MPFEHQTNQIEPAQSVTGQKDMGNFQPPWRGTAPDFRDATSPFCFGDVAVIENSSQTFGTCQVSFEDMANLL